MNKWIFAFLFGTFLSLNLANARECTLEFKKMNLCGAIEFSTAPKVSTDSPFVVSFWNAQNGDYALPSQKLEVELWMPSMGHGSRPVKIAAFPATGVAYVSSVFFIMPGDWEIRVRFKQANSSGVEQVVDQAALKLDL